MTKTTEITVDKTLNKKEEAPALVIKKRRRRRRNFRYYREKHIDNLRRILEENTPRHSLLLNHLFPDDQEDDETKDDEQADEQKDDGLPRESQYLPDEALVPIDGYFYFHITSKTHLGKKILQKDEVKDILKEQCLHYSRACRVALVNYCIQEDHLHIIIAVKTDDFGLARKKASKMIGCIKQQFTRRFKIWHETVYRPQRRHRIKSIMLKSTLWNGRALIEYIADKAELLSCTLYVESNFLKIGAAPDIKALEVPPSLVHPSENGYEPIQKLLETYKFHSAGWYAQGQQGHSTALSDGTDGVWLQGEELEYWWTKSVSHFPAGWRKVWFQKGGGILVITPDSARRYHSSPAQELLGEDTADRAQVFGHFLRAACWQSRDGVWASIAAKQEEPGLDEV